MNNSGRNRGTILILGDGGVSSESLMRALEEDEFLVRIVQDYASAAALDDEAGTCLVLCIVPRSAARSSAVWSVIGSRTRGRGAPVVVLSPHADGELCLKAYDSGVREIIGTPCSARHIRDRISAILAGGDAAARSPAEFMRSVLDGIAQRDRMLSRALRERSKGGPAMYRRAGAASLTGKEKTRYAELRRALRNNEFVLYYQPVVSISTGAITGFEALVRWNHPESGILPPDEFIPLAEKTDLIIALGMWVVEEAARQLGIWQRSFRPDPPLSMSVNISARQFIQHGLSRQIEEIIVRHGIDPSTMRLEITESAFMEDMEAANLVLLELKSKNFQLYMDDFGTGYSSLSYLTHFPVDVLKIDKSFVRFMHVDEESAVIVQSVIALAHNLKRTVIAEGVETREHYEILKELGCDYGQGYLFARPLDPAAAEEMLAKGAAARSFI